MNYFYGFVAFIFTVMTVGASPSQRPSPPVLEEIKEQKEVLNKQKDCMKKIQSKQQEIANELSKIKELIKKN
jgi:hypothetical protein|tara:strand:+ start:339 stop:554 length:216 start_codon:yes stop_codon:yes gene_type:complete